jgi:arylsulfatase A-like enzyme
MIDKKIVDRTSFSSVDFKPTLLGLLNIKETKRSEGKDLSSYLLGKSIPENKNVTFIRSATHPKTFKGDINKSKWNPWIAAITPRYKLIHTLKGSIKPWLIDLEKDPNELYNKYEDPAYTKIIHELSKQMMRYGKNAQDQIVLHPKSQKELTERI